MNAYRGSSAGVAVVVGVLTGAWLVGPPATRVESVSARAELELVVNLAARRLDVYENGERTRSYPVAVGSPRYFTPTGSYKVSRAIWNPWWHPPNSAWARNQRPKPPGPTNPMGRVKLNFANLLYIHGTSQEHSLGQPASHGCIRMANEDAIELARLVHAYASPGITEEALDRLEASPRSTRTIRLRRPVPLQIRYDVAEIHEGYLQVHPDIYGRKDAFVRKAVLAVLERAGHTESEVDADAVATLVGASRRHGTTVPVHSVLVSPPVAASPER